MRFSAVRCREMRHQTNHLQFLVPALRLTAESFDFSIKSFKMQQFHGNTRVQVVEQSPPSPQRYYFIRVNIGLEAEFWNGMAAPSRQHSIRPVIERQISYSRLTSLSSLRNSKVEEL